MGIKKLHMDLPPQVSMCRVMDERLDDNVRTLFTQIGCIMEDVSVVALIWERADAMTIDDRYQRLLLANYQITEALASIKSIIDAN